MAATVAATIAVSAACSSPGGTRQVATARPAPAATTNTDPPTTLAPTTTRAPTLAPSASTSTLSATPTRPAATATPGANGAAGTNGAAAPSAVWTPGPWSPAGRAVNGTPAVFTTLVQSSGGLQVGAARLDTSRLRVVLYAGTTDPSGTWSAQGAVASSLWPTLVATFNSGFQLNSSRGGYYADGREAPPLRAGAASLVIFRDGSATVGSWGRDVQLSADVVAVRQNLELLVDGGRPSPQIATDIQPTWGFTLNNVINNWRSAVGVDSSGRLVYVGGPGLDPAGLAGALLAVGVQRAMELDINPAWVSFNTFADGAGGTTGTKLLAGMNFPTDHYLSSSTRDFFAVFSR